MWDGINKRAFPRANYPCRIRVVSKIFSHTYETHTENIGIGGVCVILDKALNKYSDVDLEIFLDDQEAPVRCMGRIVWVVKRAQYIKNQPNCFDIGIEFLDMSSHDKARISALVDRLRIQEAKE